MENSKIKSLTGKMPLLLKTQKEFPQQFKQRLVLQSNNVRNPYKFVAGLFTEGVLSDGSSDPEAVFGLGGMIVQHAMIIACSKGAEAVGGLMKALEGSGNLHLVSALHTWAKQDLLIETDDYDGDLSVIPIHMFLSDQNEGMSGLEFPATQQLWRNVTSQTESSLIGAKVIDKIISRMEESFMVQLEGHLVGKASEIINAEDFFASLVYQNVLEGTGTQLIAAPEVQEWQQIEKAITAACSIKAIGSLVLALQSCNNERILAETYEWLQTLPERGKNYSIAVKSLANQPNNETELSKVGLQTTDYLTVQTPTKDMKEKLEVNGEHVSEYCLGLPTVLRRILENFSNKELIQLSTVNKLWNFEARSVMRERGSLRADTRRGGNNEADACKKFVAFVSDLEKMTVVPFSGIHVKIYHSNDCQMTYDGSLDQSYKVILDRLTWKRFSVWFFGDRKDCKGCPALTLVERILQDYSGVLETLVLRYGREIFYQSIFHGRSFRSLKILEIEPGGRYEDVEPWTSTFIRAMVSSAPNLQELHVKSRINLRVNVLEGSSAVLVPDYRFCPVLERIGEELIGSIRAKNMEVRIQNAEVDPQLLNTYIPKLLEASRNTLKTLFMDLLFAVPLMSYGICFENVSELRIMMNGDSHQYIEPSVLALTRGLDLTRIFPKLNQVHIMGTYDRAFSSYVVDDFVERGNAALRNALPDRAANIKLLKFSHFTSIQRSTIPLLAQIFPDVKKIEFIRTPSFPFTFLQSHFERLEEKRE